MIDIIRWNFNFIIDIDILFKEFSIQTSDLLDVLALGIFRQTKRKKIPSLDMNISFLEHNNFL